MAVKRVSKEALIGETILFVNSDKENEFESISPSFSYNLIDIISLDGLGGNPLTPNQGQYNIFVQTDEDSGFKIVSDNGSIDASKTGGSSLSDGIQEGAVFVGVPLSIKIVPKNVNAPAYRVFIKQLSSQLTKIPEDFIKAFEDVTPGNPALGVTLKNTNEFEIIIDKSLSSLIDLNEAVLNELKLLNLRTEEMGNTGINLNDIGL